MKSPENQGGGCSELRSRARWSRSGVLLGRQYTVGRAVQEGSCAAGPLLSLNISGETGNPGESVVGAMVLRELLLLLCLSIVAVPQDRPIDGSLTTVTVCEALQSLHDSESQPMAIAGRFSMRSGAHWMSQECGAGKSVKLRLILDDREAPQLPPNAVMDERVAREKLREVRRTTSLEKFRFGSADYDRWAVVFGSLHRTGDELHLSYRGDGVVFFYPEN